MQIKDDKNPVLRQKKTHTHTNTSLNACILLNIFFLSICVKCSKFLPMFKRTLQRFIKENSIQYGAKPVLNHFYNCIICWYDQYLSVDVKFQPFRTFMYWWVIVAFGLWSGLRQCFCIPRIFFFSCLLCDDLALFDSFDNLWYGFFFRIYYGSSNSRETYSMRNVVT